MTEQNLGAHHNANLLQTPLFYKYLHNTDNYVVGLLRFSDSTCDLFWLPLDVLIKEST